MTCYHPLKGWPVGITESGKPKYFITSYQTNHVELQQGKWLAIEMDKVTPYAEDVRYKSIDIPCGQCYGCRMQYSREWADRCMLEMKEHDENWFITLTYCDECLIEIPVTDDETGEIFEFGTLVKKDLQDFWKRLRKAVEPAKIRYYAAGEYGEESFRPHYHAIVFGLHIPDLEYYKSDGCFVYYKSAWLEDIWKFGNVVVAAATWETAAYTARYVVKKWKVQKNDPYYDLNIEPEFVTMSRGGSSPAGENLGGIGKQYFVDRGKELFEYDRIYLDTGKDSKEFVPPRYYKRLLDQIDPEEGKRRHEERMKKAMQALAAKRKQTSVSYLDMLQIEEDAKIKQTASLQRKEL